MSSEQTKTVLVVGASSGIGRACARSLAAAGWRVFGTTRRPLADVARALHEEIRGSAKIELLCMDVDEERSVVEGVGRLVDLTGRLDAVINCAGIGIGGSVEDTSDEEAKAIFETNVFGTLRVCRAVLPIMRRQRSGTIINLSSLAGRIPVPFQGLYSATKAAVESASESLRMEVERFGVRVVLLEPGDFATAFTDNRRAAERADSEAYGAAYRRALGIAERDERSGPTPDRIGRQVVRILRSETPRLRYTAGAPFQRLAVHLRTLLPGRLFRWSLRKYYHVD